LGIGTAILAGPKPPGVSGCRSRRGPDRIPLPQRERSRRSGERMIVSGSILAFPWIEKPRRRAPEITGSSSPFDQGHLHVAAASKTIAEYRFWFQSAPALRYGIAFEEKRCLLFGRRRHENRDRPLPKAPQALLTRAIISAAGGPPRGRRP